MSLEIRWIGHASFRLADDDGVHEHVPIRSMEPNSIEVSGCKG